MFPQVFHFCGALEIARVEHTNLHEDKILVNFRKHPHDRQQRVQAEAVEAVDKKYGGARVGIAGRGRFFHGRQGVVRQRGGDEFVEAVQFFLRLAVMVFHPEREADQQAGDQQRGPAALVKLHDAKRHEDAAGEQQADAVDDDFGFPFRLLGAFEPPMPHHAELREAEGDEDVDKIEVAANDPKVREALVVHDRDLQQVVNEFRAAEAEAELAINGQRIVERTAIRCVEPVIDVNNVPVGTPTR